MIRKIRFRYFCRLRSRPLAGEAAPPAPPPPATPPPEGDGEDADLMSFTAPDADVVDAALRGDAIPPQSGDPLPPPAKDPPKPPEPKATDPKPPKPGDPPPKDPPAKQLRDELTATKAELSELKQRLEAGDPRIAQAQADVKAKQDEIAALKKQTEEYELKLMIAKPEVRKNLDDLVSNYQTEAARFFTRVPEMNRNTMTQLVTAYANLPFGKEGYKEARATFEEDVNKALGAGEGHEHRKLESVLSMVERTYDFINARDKAEAEITTNVRERVTEAEKQTYRTKKERVDSLLAAAAEVPEDLEQNDPWHPRCALKKFMDVMPDKGEAIKKNIPEFVRLVIAGVPPRSSEIYAGMSEEQIADSRARESERVEKARAHSADILYNGAVSLRMMPILVKEIQRQRAIIDDLKAGKNPPDPTKLNGESHATSEDDEIANFRAPDLSNVNF